MSCPVCGDRCTCSCQDSSRASVLIDPEIPEFFEEQFEASLKLRAGEESLSPVGEGPIAPAGQPSLTDDEPWRREVASRVDAFCARRGRKRGPRLASMSLDFEPARPLVAESSAGLNTSSLAAKMAPQVAVCEPDSSNIIEFPRPVLAPPPPPMLPFVEELAEPVIQTPRILEAEPEDIGLLVGGQPMPSITLESPPAAPAETFPEPAALSHRAIGGALDAMVVLAATGVFGWIVAKITANPPTSRAALAAGVAVPLMFWGLYEYVFWVYAGATVGMRLTKLELRTFETAPVPRRTRRWRAMAMMVSAMSLGMGFLWAVIDEDGLCWHDRISRTLLRPR
jgi:uncharacterized RDD family membrane protein YckC